MNVGSHVWFDKGGISPASERRKSTGRIVETDETFAWVRLISDFDTHEYAVNYEDLEEIVWTHNQSSISPDPNSE